MASLFALGVMSVTWMALVAGVIAVEKTVPWRRFVTFAAAGLLLGLGLLLLLAPEGLAGLTTPSGMTM
jgi:predicted metal-binding membrane protein